MGVNRPEQPLPRSLLEKARFEETLKEHLNLEKDVECFLRLSRKGLARVHPGSGILHYVQFSGDMEFVLWPSSDCWAIWILSGGLERSN